MWHAQVFGNRVGPSVVPHYPVRDWCPFLSFKILIHQLKPILFGWCSTGNLSITISPLLPSSDWVYFELNQNLYYSVKWFYQLFIDSDGTGIQCCSADGQFLNKTEVKHPACLPIEIPVDDPFYSRFGQRCMNFVRTTPAPRLDCLLGYAEQVIGRL